MDDDKKTIGAVVVGVILVVLFLIGVFSGGKSSSSPASGRPPEMSEAEYNYVNGRMRQEGMNTTDANKATQAVWNAHQAEQERKRK